MYDHYTLDVRAAEHRYELRQDAEIDRLLKEGRLQRAGTLATWMRGLAGHLACRWSGWRYRWLVRRKVRPEFEPCSG